MPGFEFEPAELERIATRKPFFQGRLIGVQGQVCEGLHLIEEGQVLLSRANAAGEDYALFMMGPGHAFGAGALRPDGRWLVTARALTNGVAHVVAPAHVPKVFQYYPALGMHLLRVLTEGLERAYRRQDVAQSPNARERLFQLLSLMADCHGKPHGAETWMPLRLTQAELGEMAGLARETVARALADLETEGLVRRDGRKGLWVRTEQSASG